MPLLFVSPVGLHRVDMHHTIEKLFDLKRQVDDSDKSFTTVPGQHGAKLEIERIRNRMMSLAHSLGILFEDDYMKPRPYLLSGEKAHELCPGTVVTLVDPATFKEEHSNGLAVLEALPYEPQGVVFQAWSYYPEDAERREDLTLYKIHVRLITGQIITIYNPAELPSPHHAYTDKIDGTLVPWTNMLTFNDIKRDVDSGYIVQTCRFVNVYLKDQAYGGPEEGGWYYDTYAPIAYGVDSEYNEDELMHNPPTLNQEPCSYQIIGSGHPDEFIAETETFIEKENSTRPPISSTRSIGRFVAWLSAWPPEYSPDYKPHYE